jgi:hypothetical protein
MAGTLPHAVFVETGAPPDGAVLAFAAELPGCAAGGGTPEAAVAALPVQVATFTAWLRAHGHQVDEPVGNWYEVERADAGSSRAVFSLDDLDPSAAERVSWLEWLELAREELAARLDSNPVVAGSLGWLAAQDRRFAETLDGDPVGSPESDPLDELYAARDRLAQAMAADSAPGLRAILRITIADDLRAAR